MVRVTPNIYLDRRRPEWVDAELHGAIRYDYDLATGEGSRLVEIHDSHPAIQAACTRGR